MSTRASILYVTEGEDTWDRVTLHVYDETASDGEVYLDFSTADRSVLIPLFNYKKSPHGYDLFRRLQEALDRTPNPTSSKQDRAESGEP